MEEFGLFSNYLLKNSDINPYKIDYKDYFDNYTTFMMIREKSNLNIKKHRMYFIINLYFELNNISNQYNIKNYIKHYSNNITDNYNFIYNPPSSLLYEYEKKQKKEEEIMLEEYNSDINIHFRVLEHKFNYYNNIETNSNDNESNYDNFSLYEESINDYNDYSDYSDYEICDVYDDIYYDEYDYDSEDSIS